MAKVHIDEQTGCWLWQAATSRDGYGFFTIRTRLQGVAHRWAYETFVGPIPPGLHLDHLCRVRNCVNPEHLEPVTSRENSLRGDTFQARNVAKTHCPKGHGYTEENTYRDKRGARFCRECRRIRNRMLYQRDGRRDGNKPRPSRARSAVAARAAARQ